MTNAPTLAPKTAPSQLGQSRIPVWVAVILAIGIGALSAVQSRVNGELGAALEDGFLAATISFGSGLLILAAAMAFSPVGRKGVHKLRVAVRERTLPWWALLGGFFGAFFVLAQSFSATLLGVALFSIGIVCGQTLSGLAVDRFGIGSGVRRRLTMPRVIGALLTLGAVAWAVSGQLNADVPLLLIWMPLVAGVVGSWQQAINGSVRIASQSVLTTTFLSFLLGSLVLAVVLVVHVAQSGLPSSLPASPWLYSGGLIGCLFVAGAALLVRIVGVFLLGLSLVAGQLFASLALDLFAPTGGAVVSLETIAGTAVALVAVAVVGIRWDGIRRSRSAR